MDIAATKIQMYLLNILGRRQAEIFIFAPVAIKSALILSNNGKANL